MPHDANGVPLAVGDSVVLLGKVVSILPTEDFCNLSVRLNLAMPPDNTQTIISSLNAKQVYAASSWRMDPDPTVSAVEAENA